MKEINDERLNLALGAAQRVALYLRDIQNVEVASFSDHDVKLKADREAHNLLTQILRPSDIPIVSEEAPQSWGLTSGLRWIIDPVDGSFNFLRKIPISCVSIALWRDQTPLLGILKDINSEDIYLSIEGKPATVNGRSISVSSCEQLSRAILSTGFSAYSDFESQKVKDFVSVMKGFAKVRLLGSAAMSLAFVASGRVDCYREDEIAIWDVAAGLALVKAAGGSYSMEPASQPHTFCVRASNGRLKWE